MSAARFQKLARECIAQLQARSVRPILVGGSGLYARAATDDISFQGTDAAVRARLEERAESEGPGALFAELKRVDPAAATTMDVHNVRRTIRALEVIEITGRPYSASLPRYRYVIPTLQIGLDLSRDVLDERVEQRTELMRKEGLVNEVEGLRGQLSVTAARALGYEQILDYLSGPLTPERENEAFALIAQKTKRLARKQMGWFGRDPRIHWIDAMDPDVVSTALDLVDRADSGVFETQDNGVVQPIVHHLGEVKK
jgi:tRNA dimethylallyltransferase